MRGTGLKVGAVVLGTVGFYTLVANSIPQVESEVPSELAFTGTVTVEQLVAAGEQLYHGAGGCTACHGLGTRAPNLVSDDRGSGLIGERCETRETAKDCKTYLLESLTAPNEFVVDGFEPIMPDMSRTLSATQIWALVAYLQSLGGVITVIPEDLPGEAGVTGAAAAAAGSPAAEARVVTTDPVEMLREFQCITCHRLGDEGGPIGPAFDGMGRRLNATALRRAILDPNAEIAAGYESFAGVMPTDFGSRLTAAQLEVLVTFLSERR